MDYSVFEFQEAEDLKELMLKNLGRKIRELRTAMGMTQQQIGDRADISYKYLGELENGNKNPSAVVICRLSKALEVPVCEILPKINDCHSIEAKDINLKRTERLFKGRKKKEIEIAMRIMEAFFKANKE